MKVLTSKVGTPYVDGATVDGNVIETGKGKKVIIFKYKARKTTERNRDTDSRILWLKSQVSLTGKPAKAAPAKEEAPAEEAQKEGC